MNRKRKRGSEHELVSLKSDAEKLTLKALGVVIPHLTFIDQQRLAFTCKTLKTIADANATPKLHYYRRRLKNENFAPSTCFFEPGKWTFYRGLVWVDEQLAKGILSTV